VYFLNLHHIIYIALFAKTSYKCNKKDFNIYLTRRQIKIAHYFILGDFQGGDTKVVKNGASAAEAIKNKLQPTAKVSLS